MASGVARNSPTKEDHAIFKLDFRSFGMRWYHRRIVTLVVFIPFTFYPADQKDDPFLEGYVSAVLAIRFGLRDMNPSVKSGWLVLDPV